MSNQTEETAGQMLQRARMTQATGEQLQQASTALGHVIAMTPTGEQRNAFCDINIALQAVLYSFFVEENKMLKAQLENIEKRAS